MPELITGKACTDVTGKLYDKVMETISADGEAIIIVPDQFVFETEKALFRRCAETGLTTSFQNIKVCTIARISDEIVKTYQKGKPPADDITKNVIMYQAIHNRGVSFSSLGRLARKQGFAAQMVKTVSLLKTEGIDCARFSEFLTTDEARAQTPALYKKMSDIAALYTEYDQMLSSKYTDKLDMTMLAASLAVKHGFFRSRNVFVDGFNSFSGSQLQLMKAIAEYSGNSCFAFVCDRSDPRDIFRTVLAEVDRISPDGIPQAFSDNSRNMSGDLIRTSELLWNSDRSDSGDISGLRVIKADDIYSEMEFIAAEIKRLVKSEGLRYNQIAVLSTDTAAYRTPAESAFSKYEIPMFCDIPESIINAPLTNLILSLLRAADEPTAENILSYIRNSFLRVTVTDENSEKFDRPLYVSEIDDFDNFLMRWNITGEKLGREFSAEGMGEHDGKLAGRAEKVRKLAVVPLLEVRGRIIDAKKDGKCTAAWLSKEICRFLFDEAGIEHSVTGAEKNAFTLWELLVQIFEAINSGIGDNKMSPAEYYTLFRDICSQTDLALPPQLADSVILGDTNRTRADGIKVVFIAGASYGKFPDESGSFGLFSEYEAELLSESQLRLSMKQEEKYSFSRYQAYRAMTLATDRLYFTYPLTSASGGAYTPSEVITDLLGRFKKLTEEYAGDISSFGDGFYCSTKGALRARYASQFGRNDPERLATLKKAMELSGDAEYADHLDTLVKERPTAYRHRLAPDVAKALFRKNSIPATSLEKLNKCRFQYFCEKGLKISIRQSINANNNDLGSAVHYVLEKVLEKYCTQMPEFFKLKDSQLKALSVKYLKEYADSKLGASEYHSRAFDYMYSGLALRCTDLLGLLQLEFMSRKYRPVLFELDFRNDVERDIPPICEETETAADPETGKEITVPTVRKLSTKSIKLSPLSIEVSPGTNVTIPGKIDRVDMFHGDDEKDYLRIVDYKTGNHKFKISNALYGINTQMLIYLIAICARNPDIAPGGVGYYLAGMTGASMSDHTLLEMIAGGHLPSDMFIRTNSTEEEQTMFASRYINSIYGGDPSVSAEPLTVSDVTPKNDAVPDAEQFKMIVENVIRQTRNVISKLYSGDVSAIPTIYKDASSAKQCACDYCAFKSLCGHQEPAGCYVDENIAEKLIGISKKKPRQDGAESGSDKNESMNPGETAEKPTSESRRARRTSKKTEQTGE